MVSESPMNFSSADTLWIAKTLLGYRLVCMAQNHENHRLVAKVVETEAYTHQDPACLHIRKRPAIWNLLCGEAGHLYFHYSYGQPLLNITTGPQGVAGCILIRAVEPLEGLEQMRLRRPGKRDRDLTNGPAKLVQALGLNPAWNSLALAPERCFFLPPDAANQSEQDSAITTAPRIGLKEGKELPWRFYLTDNSWVSVC
jgi:DNA-3-methyladenine glycosylase